MKNIFTLTYIAIALFACQPKTDKEKLDNLKKQQSDLKEQIVVLETKLAQSDTLTDKSKLVGITEMTPTTFKHYIEIQGKVDGDQDVMLSAESAGTVTSIFSHTGDHVTKGQILATIDDKILLQNQAEVQTQLDLSTTLFNRQKNLWDQKIGSEVQYLQAKTGKEAVEKRIAMINQQIQMTKIKSPFNGIVDDIVIKVGQTVGPGMPCIRVINMSELKVKGEVAESFITRVKKGDEALLFFPDQNKELATTVSYSGGRIDPLNRTFKVEVKLSEKEGDFKPNMIAILKIVDYKNTSAFIVPVAAVQKSGEGEYVFVKTEEGGKSIAKRKIVTVGTIYNGQAEIKSGLVKGDEVITNGYSNVIEGDAVKI